MVGWKLLHYFIIFLFLMQTAYCGFQVFFVLQPDWLTGPIGIYAFQIPADIFLWRRLYAIEGWVGGSGLVIYLALTEILPRKMRQYGLCLKSSKQNKNS